MPLSLFHPAVARWFEETLGPPTATRAKGWAAIRGRRHTLIAFEKPSDVLAQQIVAESAADTWSEQALFDSCRRAWPYRTLQRDEYDAVVRMIASGYTTRHGRRGTLVHHDGVNGRIRRRRRHFARRVHAPRA